MKKPLGIFLLPAVFLVKTAEMPPCFLWPKRSISAFLQHNLIRMFFSIHTPNHLNGNMAFFGRAFFHVNKGIISVFIFFHWQR